MYYIYYHHVSSGREDFVAVKDTMKDAVAKIRQCYEIDKDSAQTDEYYYFMKKH